MFKYIFVLLLVFISGHAFAQVSEFVEVKTAVSLSVEYVIPDEQLTIEQIKQLSFVKTTPMFSLGSPSSHVWIRLTVQNTSNRSLQLFLNHQLAYMANEIDIYEVLNDGSQLFKKYDLSGTAEHAQLSGGGLIYQFSLEAHSHKVIYIKSNSSAIQLFNFKVSSLNHLLMDLPSEHSLAYLICYSILAIALYNFILFVLAKRLEHLFYALYLLNSAIGLMYLYGLMSSNFGFQGANSQWLVITSMLVPLFLSLFVQNIFDTKTKNSKLHLSLHVITLLSICNVIIAFLIDLPLAIELNPITFNVSFMVMFAVIIYFTKQKHPLVKLFFIAYLLYLVGMMGTLLSVVTLTIPLSSLSFYSSGIGVLIECFLFSYLLHYRVKLLEDEVVNQRNNIILQNKKIQMGDMIGAITHQWKQPLSAIGSVVTMLQYKLDDEKRLNKNELRQSFNNISDKVQFMSETINDFRLFFRPDKESQLVKIEAVIKQASSLIHEDFLALNVTIKTELIFTKSIKTFHNELLHIILNILQNALDAFKNHDVLEKVLFIRGYNDDNSWTIEIEDNAGGIDEQTLPLIFDENFTSKAQSFGSGIGLYLTRFIIEKHLNGFISAENTAKGICFKLVLKDLKQ